MAQQRKVESPLSSLRPTATVQDLVEMQRQVLTVHVSPLLRQYILSLVGATRADTRLALGVSPRGSLALYKGAQALAAIRGRAYAVPEDVRDIATPVLIKRMILKEDASSRGITEESIVAELLEKIPVPPIGTGAESG
jgi:MoxR-like ATPase